MDILKQALPEAIGAILAAVVLTIVGVLWARCKKVRRPKDPVITPTIGVGSVNTHKQNKKLNNLLIFFSGSELVSSPATERHRFIAISRKIGQSLGELNFGVVGCPPHPSRVLASVEAMKGATEARPKAPTSYGDITFPLDNLQRARFVHLSAAAIFIGGSSGTLREFQLCVEANLKPLIPIAGAGGTGEKLALRLLNEPDTFFDAKVKTSDITILADASQPIEAYEQAVINILIAHQVNPPTIDWQDFQKDPKGESVGYKIIYRNIDSSNISYSRLPKSDLESIARAAKLKGFPIIKGYYDEIED